MISSPPQKKPPTRVSKTVGKLSCNNPPVFRAGLELVGGLGISIYFGRWFILLRISLKLHPGRFTSLNLKIHRFEKDSIIWIQGPIIFRFDSLIFRGCILVVYFRYLRRNNIKWHAHTHKSRSLSSESSRVCRHTGPFLASEPPQSTMSIYLHLIWFWDFIFSYARV